MKDIAISSGLLNRGATNSRPCIVALKEARFRRSAKLKIFFGHNVYLLASPRRGPSKLFYYWSKVDSPARKSEDFQTRRQIITSELIKREI